MSAQFKFENHERSKFTQGKVKVTDLISRMNDEKKVEKKKNLVLGVATISAVTFFGIILTI
tara:strand:+ start:518 stop:700 length:183 start_codon:yes stop_codon:yes gene_type:complete